MDRLIGRVVREPTYRILRYLTIILPLLFLSGYYYLMLGPAHELFHSVKGFLLLMTVLAVLVILFASAVFGMIQYQHATILRQNRELAELGERLRRLNETGTVLAAQVDYPAALHQIARQSRWLLEARLAGLAVLDDQGRPAEVVTDGGEESDHHQLAALLSDGDVLLRVAATDQPVPGEALGWSERAPLIGVRLSHNAKPLGVLLLADPTARSAFSATDQDLLQLFAAQAGVVLENARLYREVKVLATEQERSRIAREMHDGIAQVLAYVNAKAQAIDEFLNQGQVEMARQQLQQLSEAARRVYADVREAILGLRTQIGPERSMLQALTEYVTEFQSQSGIETTLVATSEDLRMDPAHELQVLRIVQEALTNVRRHSGATAASVRFDRSPDGMVVTITDNGRGIRPEEPKRSGRPHFGLQTMRERAESIGAALRLEALEEGGTRVTLTLPARRETQGGEANPIGGER